MKYSELSRFRDKLNEKERQMSDAVSSLQEKGAKNPESMNTQKEDVVFTDGSVGNRPNPNDPDLTTEDVKKYIKDLRKKGRPTLVLLLVPVIAMIAVIIGLAVYASSSSKIEQDAWGPQDRETYSWESRADHVVFNSITDNPYLGDERNFVRIRKVGDEEETDEIELEDGQEYQVTIYYHNDADSALNESGEGISRNTYVRTKFPSVINKNEIGVISGYITSSNATPEEIWDSSYVTAKDTIYLSYVANSGVIHCEGDINGTIMSKDALLSDQGATIAVYDNMWGMIPAGTEYGGYITYRIKASKEESAPETESNTQTNDMIFDSSWGPQDRETFTWDSWADYPVFNSITDNPYLGDERNFVRIRGVGDQEESDEVELESGKEYQVSVYYHNNASPELNDDEEGFAQGVYMQIAFPKYLQKGQIGVVASKISAENTDPRSIWDTAYIKADQDIYIEYVPDSAYIHNNGTADGSQINNEALQTSGAAIAYWDDMWGVIPGGSDYGGYVTFRITANTSTPNGDQSISATDIQRDSSFPVEMSVRKIDDRDWSKEIEAEVGDVLEYQIHYKNVSAENKDVVAKIVPPESLQYVIGSTKLYNTTNPEGIVNTDDTICDTGINIGGYASDGDAYIRARFKVINGSVLQSGKNELICWGQVDDGTGTKQDSAGVIVFRN